MGRIKLMEYLCCVMSSVPPRNIDASRFWSLQTWLKGDSEVSCAPESDPVVDVGLTLFTMDDGTEYPPSDDKPFPDDLPRLQAMRVRHGWSGKSVGGGAYILGS
jgi:hypothetical protein